MLVFIIFLMLQSLAMDSAAISGWSMKQAEFIAACYWKNQELSIRSLCQLQGWSYKLWMCFLLIYFYKNFICWTRAKVIILVRWQMLVFVIFLMLQSLAMGSVAISRWSMKQAEFIAACYWKNQELSIRSLHQLQGWS